MSPDWRERLNDAGKVLLDVHFETRRRTVTTYAVVLLLDEDGAWKTVRVYDGAHGQNEMHRHTRSGGKHAPTVFHAGTLGEGMRAAIDDCRHGYREMIEGWNR